VLAFRDTDFLLREELRPVRFQLELLKPEMLLEEAGIGSTLVIYGSARIPSPEQAKRSLSATTTPNARPWPSGWRQGEILRRSAQAGPHRQRMRDRGEGHAPVRGLLGRRAVDHGSGQSRRGPKPAPTSIGLNIVLPHEQAPNAT
jgi:hypothetical protein